MLFVQSGLGTCCDETFGCNDNLLLWNSVSLQIWNMSSFQKWFAFGSRSSHKTSVQNSLNLNKAAVSIWIIRINPNQSHWDWVLFQITNCNFCPMAAINDFFGSTVDESVVDSTVSAFSNLKYDITHKQRTKWQRRSGSRGSARNPNPNSNLTSSSSSGPGSKSKSKSGSKSSGQNGGDRFIPLRDEHQFDQQQSYHSAEHKLAAPSSTRDDDKEESESPRPSDTRSTSKILSFQAAAPEAADGYISNLRTLYTVPSASSSSNRSGASFRGKSTRSICQTAKRVLDAPDLRDDYYLNLLHWGRTNEVAIGLGSALYLWNAADGTIKLLVDLGQDTQVCSVRWNHNGQYIAVGDSQNTVTLYDAATHKTLRKLHGHASRVGALSWNHSVLSTGSADSTIRNNDVRIKRYTISTLQCHEQEICGLQWNNDADGTHLASGTALQIERATKSQNIYNDGDGERESDKAVHCRNIRIWTCTLSQSLHSRWCTLSESKMGENHKFSFSENATLSIPNWLEIDFILISGSNDNKACVWRLNEGPGPICEFVESQSAVKALAFCPWNHSLLATGGGMESNGISHLICYSLWFSVWICYGVDPQGAQIVKSEFTTSRQEAQALWSNRSRPSLRFHRWSGTRSNGNCYRLTDSAGTSCRCGSIRQWKRRMIWPDTLRASWALHCPPTGRWCAVPQQMKHWDFGTFSRRNRLWFRILEEDQGQAVRQRTGNLIIRSIWGYGEWHSFFWLVLLVHFFLNLFDCFMTDSVIYNFVTLMWCSEGAGFLIFHFHRLPLEFDYEISSNFSCGFMSCHHL